jgi:hypothetical protein
MTLARGGKRITWQALAIGAIVLLAAVPEAAPALADGPPIGQISKAAGTVTVVRGTSRLPAKPGDPVYQSDVIETGTDGDAAITFTDNSRFSAGPGSNLALREYHFDTASGRGGMTAALQKGTLAVTSGAITHNTPGAMHIQTPTSILGVRGTTFGVEVGGNPPKERFVVFPNPDGGSGAIAVGSRTGTTGAAGAR